MEICQNGIKRVNDITLLWSIYIMDLRNNSFPSFFPIHFFCKYVLIECLFWVENYARNLFKDLKVRRAESLSPKGLTKLGWLTRDKPRFIEFHFIALHRCCVFYKFSARPSTKKKKKKDNELTHCSCLELSLQYLSGLLVRGSVGWVNACGLTVFWSRGAGVAILL